MSFKRILGGPSNSEEVSVVDILPSRDKDSLEPSTQVTIRPPNGANGSFCAVEIASSEVLDNTIVLKYISRGHLTVEIGTTEPNGPGCNLKPQKSTKVNTCSQPIGAEVDPTEEPVMAVSSKEEEQQKQNGGCKRSILEESVREKLPGKSQEPPTKKPRESLEVENDDQQDDLRCLIHDSDSICDVTLSDTDDQEMYSDIYIPSPIYKGPLEPSDRKQRESSVVDSDGQGSLFGLIHVLDCDDKDDQGRAGDSGGEEVRVFTPKLYHQVRGVNLTLDSDDQDTDSEALPITLHERLERIEKKVNLILDELLTIQASQPSIADNLRSHTVHTANTTSHDRNREFMMDGINLLTIPSRDVYAYALALLDIFFDKETLAKSLVFKSYKSNKPELDPVRVRKIFDCIKEKYGTDYDHRKMVTKMNSKCYTAKKCVQRKLLPKVDLVEF